MCLSLCSLETIISSLLTSFTRFFLTFCVITPTLSAISFVLIQIFTDIYSIADLGGYSFLNIKIGNVEFLITDPINIFPLFMITFELGRISLRKTKGDDLLFKDIILISLVVSFFGFCFQPIIDFTAAAVGFYYYRTPPELNIFSFPIIFLFAFSIYGLFAFIFLLIESHYKKMNQEIN